MAADLRDTGLHVEYPGTTSAINRARVDLVEWLHRLELSTLAGDAELVVSELVSNAVEASPDLPFEVRATIDPAGLGISVRNVGDSSRVPTREFWQPGDPLAPRGRGLGIVDALTDSVEVRQDRGWVVVTVRFSV